MRLHELNRHSHHLTHRIEALLCVVANVAGDLTRIEEVRRLGQAH